MDYLPFPGYTDPDDIEIPNSPLEVQSRALKEAININDINFRFLSGRRNILYGEAPLTEKARSILNIDNAPKEEKEGSLLIKSLPLQLATTVTWAYHPEHDPNVLRLWVTSSVKQTSSEEADQCLTALKQQGNNQHDREPGEQFYQMNNQPTQNKSSKSNEIFELLNSDEFVNACLTWETITLIFSAIMFPLLNFCNNLNQRQQTSLISTATRQS